MGGGGGGRGERWWGASFNCAVILSSYLPTPRVQKPGDNPKNFEVGAIFISRPFFFFFF